MNVDVSIKYTDCILVGSVIKKYQQFPKEHKELSNVLDEYQWSIGSAKGVYIERFYKWAKLDAISGLGDPIRRLEQCTYF